MWERNLDDIVLSNDLEEIMDIYLEEAILQEDKKCQDKTWEDTERIIEEVKETGLYNNMLSNIDSHYRVLSYILISNWLWGKDKDEGTEEN